MHDLLCIYNECNSFGVHVMTSINPLLSYCMKPMFYLCFIIVDLLTRDFACNRKFTITTTTENGIVRQYVKFLCFLKTKNILQNLYGVYNL